jgi:hypothetical protein
MKNKRPGPTVIQRVATLVNDEEYSLGKVMPKNHRSLFSGPAADIAKGWHRYFPSLHLTNCEAREGKGKRSSTTWLWETSRNK